MKFIKTNLKTFHNFLWAASWRIRNVNVTSFSFVHTEVNIYQSQQHGCLPPTPLSIWNISSCPNIVCLTALPCTLLVATPSDALPPGRRYGSAVEGRCFFQDWLFLLLQLRGGRMLFSFDVEVFTSWARFTVDDVSKTEAGRRSSVFTDGTFFRLFDCFFFNASGLM